MRLRQVALVAEKLESALDDLRIPLGLEVCYRDPGVAEFGLENGLLLAGDTFLEVVSPVRPGTTAGRLLARRGGDGGYMVLLQTDALAADRERLAASSVRIVWEIELSDIAAVHLHPKDIGGAIVSLDAPQPPHSWRWGGPDWESLAPSKVTVGITAVEIQGDEPEALALRWSRVLDQPISERAEDRFAISLDAGELRFVPARDGRGDGVSAVEFAVHAREHVLACARARGLRVEASAFVACGTRILLRDAAKTRAA